MYKILYYEKGIEAGVTYSCYVDNEIDLKAIVRGYIKTDEFNVLDRNIGLYERKGTKICYSVVIMGGVEQ